MKARGTGSGVVRLPSAQPLPSSWPFRSLCHLADSPSPSHSHRLRRIDDERSPIPQQVARGVRRPGPVHSRTAQCSAEHRVHRQSPARAIHDGWAREEAGTVLGIGHQSVSIPLPLFPWSASFVRGRKTDRLHLLRLLCATVLIGVVVQSTSHQIGVFIASRAIIGAGLTFATNAAPILITELAYPTQRAPLTALYSEYSSSSPPEPGQE